MTKKGGDLALLRRSLREARPFWPLLALIFVLDLGTVPLALLAPLPLKIAVDSAVGTRPLPSWLGALVSPGADPQHTALWIAAGLVVAIAAVRQLIEAASAYLHTHTGEKLVLDVRAHLFRHSQRLSLAYHDARGAADSIYRIQWDVPSLRHIAIDGLPPLLTSLAMLVAMVAVVASIDWTLALVALAVTPVLLLLIRAYRDPLRRRYRQIKQHETSAVSVVQEVLSALRVVKAFGKEEHEHERFLRHSGAGTQARLRVALFQSGFDLSVGLVTAVGTAAVLLLGVGHVRSGAITLGDLLVVMAYLAMLYAPLRSISTKAADVQASLSGVERAFALLDAPRDVVERPGARPLAKAAGAVAFRGVSFSYDPARQTLSDVSFDVPVGARVGIAGATGAGKTTLVSLLMRFYDVSAGAVLLDGVDIREYRLADLRNQFSMVLQEPVLFSTSIAENISYARPDATQEQIAAAAQAANAHAFISALPNGYATLVGDRGMSLSGGERQRISLARAFLKDAPLLILDEPTSSVDVKTEAGIIDAMQRLMRGRTTFMIAHRLTTLEGCDVRIELENGRLIRFERMARAEPRA